MTRGARPNNGIVRRNISSASSSAIIVDSAEEEKEDTQLQDMMYADDASSSSSSSHHQRNNKQQIFWRTETSLSSDDEEPQEEEDNESSSAAPEVVLETTTTTMTASEELVSKEQQQQEEDRELLMKKQQRQTYTVVRDEKDGSVFVEVEVEKYMSCRTMTRLQERMNALTMIPPPLYCICFILSGNWMINYNSSQALTMMAAQQNHDPNNDIGLLGLDLDNNDNSINELCLDWASSPILGWLFRNLHAIPPLPVLAYAAGVTLHAPFSFLYHWKYAHALSPGKRTIHWSRRMDQSMLHVCSALTSLATGGTWSFFLVNALFNADSIYRQFQQEVKPRRNQGRLGVAIIAWTLPILKRGDTELFLQVIVILAFGTWLFVKYPVGGWSHSAFHLVLFPLMPLLMQVAVGLPSSQEHLQQAAQCYYYAPTAATTAIDS